MVRRLIVVAAGIAGLLGLSASPLAAPAKADPVQVYSPVHVGLLRVCVIEASQNTGLCLHV